MQTLTRLLIFISLLLSAAIFGVFYAWVCSTMWGLDVADPRVSIQAMQAMNASVRNLVFAAAFSGPPIALLATATLLFYQRQRSSALAFALSATTYTVFGMLLTMSVNVPMNETLAQLPVPPDVETARASWQHYSENWQFWNQVRTVGSGISFCLATAGVMLLGNRSPSSP